MNLQPLEPVTDWPHGRQWTLTFPGRPCTLNIERQGNRWKRAAVVLRYREEACTLAHAYRIPHLTAVEAHSWAVYRNRASWPDVGGWMPATKAAIDGLVDARVLDGDGHLIVRRLVFHAPRLGDCDELVLCIRELTDEPDVA